MSFTENGITIWTEDLCRFQKLLLIILSWV